MFFFLPQQLTSVLGKLEHRYSATKSNFGTGLKVGLFMYVDLWTSVDDLKTGETATRW